MDIVASERVETASPGAKRTLLATLAERFGDRFSTGMALRQQHANTLTWIKCEPPDAVVFAEETREVAEVVKLCAAARVPVIPFGTGSSLEGHVNAPFGGVSVDLSRMNRILAVHEEDLDCVVEPGVTGRCSTSICATPGCSSLSTPAPMRASAAWPRPALRAPTPCVTAPCATMS
jgi:D-lactate dehydrogenase (cytochrome)